MVFSNGRSTHFMSTLSALLVIDVQVGLVAGEVPTYRSDEMLGNIAGLLAKARALHTPVVFMQHESEPGSLLETNTEAWQIHPTVTPLDDEIVLSKRASDSFYETGLQRELEARGVTQLVITGCRTEACVDTTCRVAVSRGYDVTLVQDAHSTIDSDVLTAEQIVAHHNVTLDDFGNNEHVIVLKRASEVEF
jgi:nicotinamidase-related amidase